SAAESKDLRLPFAESVQLLKGRINKIIDELATQQLLRLRPLRRRESKSDLMPAPEPTPRYG
ncbi:MAG: hypothetical protein ACP5E2_14645, partial [Terracidiphilus sp.]